MPKRQVFYSFHYQNDVCRVSQVRNMGVVEGDSIVSDNDWEEVKKKGDKAIEKWINDSMKMRSCVVVLIGEETAGRKWIDYEIERAWNERKGLVGIHINNLKHFDGKTSLQGKNPFDKFTFKDGTKLSSIVKIYNPSKENAYNEIRNNLEEWIEEAINIRNDN